MFFVLHTQMKVQTELVPSKSERATISTTSPPQYLTIAGIKRLFCFATTSCNVIFGHVVQQFRECFEETWSAQVCTTNPEKSAWNQYPKFWRRQICVKHCPPAPLHHSRGGVKIQLSANDIICGNARSSLHHGVKVQSLQL